MSQSLMLHRVTKIEMIGPYDLEVQGRAVPTMHFVVDFAEGYKLDLHLYPHEDKGEYLEIPTLVARSDYEAVCDELAMLRVEVEELRKGERYFVMEGLEK